MKKFKRLIAIVTVLLFALSIVAPALAQDEAAASSVYDDAAKILKDKGIMVGNESGDLMLDKQLTRAEILKMIILSTGQGDVVQDYVYAEQSFKDVPNTHWAFAYVEAGKDLGIVNGYPDGTFKPDQPVKFEELCKMLVAAKGESPASGKWPVNYVRKALDLGYFTQIEDEVGIGDYVIRGQAAVAFANAFFPPEKTIAIKEVKALANDSIQVAVSVYLNGEPATLEDGDIMPMDITIKDASDESKTLAVTAIDTDKSDFANGIVVFKTAAQTEGANYKVFYKDQDTNLTFAGAALQLQVAKVEVPNLKQVVVTFNRDVKADVGGSTSNYVVKVGETSKAIGAVRLSADKKVATLILNDNLSNNDTVNVTVKKEVGLTEDFSKSVGPVVDSTAPTVTKVVALTPQKLQVEFSEPVTNYSTASNYTVNNMYIVKEAKGFAEDNTIDPNIVILNLYIPVNVGANTLGIPTAVTDIAGFSVVNRNVSFSVVQDTTALELKNATATLSQVKLEFSKAIQSIVSYSLSNGTVTGTSIDGNVVTISSDNDNLSNCIPISGTKVTIQVKDYAGNTASFEKYVVPTIDTERPVVKSVSVADSSTIKLTFSEDVRVPNPSDNAVIVKDKDGNQVVITNITYDTDSNNNQIKNVLKVTVGSALPAGAVSVTVSGVQDNTPLKNASLPQTLSATLADTAAPTITQVVYKELASDKKTELYILFDKTLDAASASTVGNYKYLNTSMVLKDFSGATVSLLPNNKVVKLTIPYDSNNNSILTSLSYLQIIGVKDTLGNAATIAYSKSDFIADTSSTVALISGTPVTATSANKIELAFNNAINEYTLYAGDFVVTAGSTTIPVINATWDATNKKVILTLGYNLSNNAQYNNTNVSVTIKSASITKDILGNSITAASNVTVVDKIAPTISSVDVTYDTTAASTYVAINFSENVNIGSSTDDNVLLAQFKVYINGTLTQPTVESKTATQLKLKFTGDQRYKAIKVDYIPSYTASDRVKDTAGGDNELAQTSVNGTWK